MKMWMLIVGAFASFLIMVALNLSPYSNLHYIPELAELVLLGVLCGKLSQNDSELFAMSMMLPPLANYVLGAMLVPATVILAICFYSGVYVGLKEGGECRF